MIWAEKCPILLTAIGLCILALTFQVTRDALATASSAGSALAQIATTIATMMALVFTLAIIPVARSGEAWSPALLRLYRRDRTTQATFTILGLLCILCFILSFSLGVFNQQLPLLFGLLAIAACLDLLRMYHNHVCQLLDPAYATQMLAAEASRSIDRIQDRIAQAARSELISQRSALTPDVTSADIETALYGRWPDHAESITIWVHELSELALKAVVRSDRRSASYAVTSIASIGTHYLDRRRDNLAYMPSPDSLLLSLDSDARGVLSPIYESLKDIARAASDRSDTVTSLNVCKAYAALALVAAKLPPPTSQSSSAPLAHVPLYYMQECMAYAQAKELHDVPYQGCRYLVNVAILAPRYITYTSVRGPVIDAISKTVEQFILHGQRPLASALTGHLMSVAHHALDDDSTKCEDVFRHLLPALGRLSTLAHFSLSVLSNNPQVQSSAVSTIYDPASELSFCHLLQNATTMIALDPKRPHVSPYRNYLKLCRQWRRHLLDIGEKVDFGYDWMLWEIIAGVRETGRTLLQLLRRPIATEYLNDVVDELLWFMSFLWRAFKNKMTIAPQRAEEACDTISCVGLALLDLNQCAAAKTCAGDIMSIAGFCADHSNDSEPWYIADMLEGIWCIRVLADRKGIASLVSYIDELLTKCPEKLDSIKWQNVLLTLELRKEELDNELRDPSSEMVMDQGDPAVLLRMLLGESKPEPGGIGCEET